MGRRRWCGARVRNDARGRNAREKRTQCAAAVVIARSAAEVIVYVARGATAVAPPTTGWSSRPSPESSFRRTLLPFAR